MNSTQDKPLINKALAGRVKLVIDRSKWKSIEIGKMADVSTQAVSLWRTRGFVSKENLKSLSNITGCSFEWLITGKGQPFEMKIEHGPNPDRSIPLLTNTQVNQYLSGELRPAEIKNWRQSTADVSQMAYSVRINDDTMSNPTGEISIPPKSIIVIDPGIKPKAGDIVAISIHETNDVLIKQYIIDGPNRYFNALNPKYHPLIMKKEEYTIVGVARKIEIDLQYTLKSIEYPLRWVFFHLFIYYLLTSVYYYLTIWIMLTQTQKPDSELISELIRFIPTGETILVSYRNKFIGSQPSTTTTLRL